MSERRRSYTSKKRDGHFDETSASPANASRKKPRQNFELKPRHKTREDRYNYKPNSVEAKSHAKKVKPRARRQTMNDDFHAMNVTENRLTVRRASTLVFVILTGARCAESSTWGFLARARPLPTAPARTRRSLAPCLSQIAPTNGSLGLISPSLR